MSTAPRCSPISQRVPTERQAGRLSDQFAALGDPIRLRLVSLLATATDGEVCACDLVVPLGRSQPTISHHLKVLADAGLVTASRRGRNVWYAVDAPAVTALREALAPAAG